MANEINGYKWAMCTAMKVMGPWQKDSLGL